MFLYRFFLYTAMYATFSYEITTLYNVHISMNLDDHSNYYEMSTVLL